MNKVLSPIKEFFKKLYAKEGVKKASASVITIAISLLISLIIFLFISPSDALFEFGVLITGGLPYFGLTGFFDILANAAPLICCGLCVLFAYKTGLFNIGAAGQYVMVALQHYYLLYNLIALGIFP